MTKPKSTNKNRSALTSALFWLLLSACLVIAIDGAISYQRASQRHENEQQFYQQLAQVQQNEEQNGQGVELSELTILQQRAQHLQLAVPSLDYLILYHQWLDALTHFDKLVAGAENRYVSSDLDSLRNDVHQSLLQLRARCDKQLRYGDGNEAKNNDHHWPIYNLRGAVSVMMAYSLIEFSQDSEKSRTFLADAVEDFKQSIRSVDESDVLPGQRMIPRWNLELIVGAGESVVVGRQLGGDSVEEMRGQLQAVVPNVGGYSPGAPLETRVRK
ncbi:MAG: hypothetical protein JRG71_13495 [Deltaproteobacteria bacterium]|nr:hypothetical protein [Deltaproteobacteria bacterium]